MKGIYLKFYTYELEKHHGMLIYEWLLTFAKKKGIKGGSAFRALAGYGKKEVLHEEHFFELASNVPVEVVFILSEAETEDFLELLKVEKIDLLYLKIPVEYGRLG